MNDEVEITLQQDDVTVETPLVADYILPTATANTLGGVKIGDNINIDSNGHISVPVASQSYLGVVQAGTGINIDSNGVISANGEGYTLPEATKTTLGGVYVDDELSTTSTHPVQNAVVSLELQELGGDITSVSGTVSGLSTTVGQLSTTVGNLSTTVGNLSGTVTNQGNDISTIQGNINTINGNIIDINDDLTSTGNALEQLQGNVDPVLVNDDINVPANDVDSQAWTSGSLDVHRRGKTGVLNVLLFGSKTLADNDSVVLYTLTDDNIPTFETYGNLWTDVGLMNVTISTSGNIIMQNLTGASVTITKLIGSLPIVFL